MGPCGTCSGGERDEPRWESNVTLADTRSSRSLDLGKVHSALSSSASDHHRLSSHPFYLMVSSVRRQVSSAVVVH